MLIGCLTMLSASLILTLSMNSVRTFIALPLPDSTTRRLGQLISDLKLNAPRGMRWVDEKNIHLTLVFLGDTPQDKIKELAALLADVTSRLTAPIVRFTTLGAFPNPEKMRVFWLGMDSAPALVEVNRQVNLACRQCGLPSEERRFVPHLTLARTPDAFPLTSIAQAAKLIKQPLPVSKSPLLLDQMVIFKSDLQPGGAVYTPLHRFTLTKQQEVKSERT